MGSWCTPHTHLVLDMLPRPHMLSVPDSWRRLHTLKVLDTPMLGLHTMKVQDSKQLRLHTIEVLDTREL